MRWLILPKCPKVLWSALSLTVQVLKMTKSAFSDSVGANPDLSRMNYIRIYHLGVTKDLTIKLDDIKFYQE